MLKVYLWIEKNTNINFSSLFFCFALARANSWWDQFRQALSIRENPCEIFRWTFYGNAKFARLFLLITNCVFILSLGVHNSLYLAVIILCPPLVETESTGCENYLYVIILLVSQRRPHSLDLGMLLIKKLSMDGNHLSSIDSISAEIGRVEYG